MEVTKGKCVIEDIMELTNCDVEKAKEILLLVQEWNEEDITSNDVYEDCGCVDCGGLLVEMCIFCDIPKRTQKDI